MGNCSFSKTKRSVTWWDAFSSNIFLYRSYKTNQLSNCQPVMEDRQSLWKEKILTTILYGYKSFMTSLNSASKTKRFLSGNLTLPYMSKWIFHWRKNSSNNHKLEIFYWSLQITAYPTYKSSSLTVNSIT